MTAGRTDMQSVVRVSANCVPTLSSAIREKKAANLWAKRQWHILSCRATIANVVCLPLIAAKKENGLWNNFAFFDCESRSLEEAQRLCEDWLVGQDRCYRN